MQLKSRVRRVIICSMMIQQVLGEYVKYSEPDRNCIPYLNCPPGSEILPCMKEYEQDICRPCTGGHIQLNVITSTGNTNETNCFEPKGECLARDLTYRRFPKESFCEQTKGCMCDTSKCFFGDPCLCSEKNDGCEIGKELNEKGECVDCPSGTEKNDTGCGPCHRFKYVPQNALREIPTTTVPKSLVPTTTTISSTLKTQESLQNGVNIFTSAILHKEVTKPPSTVLIVLMVSLGLAVLVLTIGVIVLLIRKPSCMIFGVCFSNHNTDNAELQRMVDTDEQQRQGRCICGNPVDHNVNLPRVQYNSPDPYVNPPNHPTSNGSNYSHSENCIDTSYTCRKENTRSHVVQLENGRAQCKTETPTEPKEDVSSDKKKLVEDIKENLSPETFKTLARISCNSHFSFHGNIGDNQSNIVNIRSVIASNSEPHFNIGQSTVPGHEEEASGSYLTMNVPENRYTRIISDAEHLQRVPPIQFYTGEQRAHNTTVKNNDPNSWSSSGGDSGIHIT